MGGGQDQGRHVQGGETTPGEGNHSYSNSLQQVLATNVPMSKIKMGEGGGQDRGRQVQVGGTTPGEGGEDLHLMSAEREVISLISLSVEVREIMGS